MFHRHRKEAFDFGVDPLLGGQVSALVAGPWTHLLGVGSTLGFTHYTNMLRKTAVQNLGLFRKEFCVCLVMSDSVIPWTLCDSSVRGNVQARTLEWISLSFSKGSLRLRDGTFISCMGR